MTRETKTWSTRELELYHDEELEPAQRSKLSEALRRDPELRERLATVRRVDDLLGAALADDAPAARRPLRLVFSRSVPVAAAAGVLIAVTAAAWFTVKQWPHGEIQVAQDANQRSSDLAGQPEYRPIRVVFSLPIGTASPEPAGRAGTTAKAETNSVLVVAAVRDDASFVARLDRMLKTGRIQEALDLLEGASDNQRAVAYRRMGELLRSAYVAEQILDRLSPREQLAVCRQWARQPQVRPTAFDRLRRFSRQPGLSGDVQVVVAELAKDPELATWLHGYQLIRADSPAEDASS